MNLSLTTHIDAPPDRVFDYFTDLDRACDRISGIVELEVLTDGPVGTGTRFRETREIMKKRTTEELEIVDFEPGRSYAVGCDSCGCSYHTRFDFVPEGSGTTVNVEMNTKPLTFMAKIFAPVGKVMMGGMMRKCMEKDLDDLRQALESDAGAHGGTHEPHPA